MRIFSSNSTHKIDAKGRVSIPAPFRKILDREEEPGVWLIPRLRGEPALEGLGNTRFEKIADAIDEMNPLDPRSIALSNKVIGHAVHLLLDENGRILISRQLRDVAGLEGQALFVGLGRSFQIWNPEVWAARQAELEEMATEGFKDLPWGGAKEAVR